MAKNSNLFTLLTGVVAGAAAVFFSNEKNRQKAKQELNKVSATARVYKKKFEDNPEETVDELVTKVETVAKKQVKKIKNKAAKFKSSQFSKEAAKKRAKKV